MDYPQLKFKELHKGDIFKLHLDSVLLFEKTKDTEGKCLDKPYFGIILSIEEPVIIAANT